MPETGSVLVAGHNPLGAFFRAAQVEPSAAGAGPTALVCDDEAVDIVDADEACEESDEDEFERWALFRGINILKSSLMGAAPLGTPLGPLHLFWKFTGGATAVITVNVQRGCPSEWLQARVWRVPSLFPHAAPWLLLARSSGTHSERRRVWAAARRSSRRLHARMGCASASGGRQVGRRTGGLGWSCRVVCFSWKSVRRRQGRLAGEECAAAVQRAQARWCVTDAAMEGGDGLLVRCTATMRRLAIRETDEVRPRPFSTRCSERPMDPTAARNVISTKRHNQPRKDTTRYECAVQLRSYYKERRYQDGHVS